MRLSEVREADLPVFFGEISLVAFVGEGTTGRTFRVETSGAGGLPRIGALTVLETIQDERDPPPWGPHLRSVQYAGLLNHPGIVRTFFYGERDDTPFVLSEWVEGPSLWELCDSGKVLEPRHVLDIGIQLCAALSAAHGTQFEGRVTPVLHLDLRPQRVLVGLDGVVKLRGFGLGGMVSARAVSGGAAHGIPPYACPELLSGSVPDQRGDLFSLGLILAEAALGGTLLHSHPSTSVTERMSELVSLVTGKGLGMGLDAQAPGFTDLLTPLLSLQPDGRPPSAVEVEARLRSARSTIAEGQHLSRLALDRFGGDLGSISRDGPPPRPMSRSDEPSFVPAPPKPPPPLIPESSESSGSGASRRPAPVAAGPPFGSPVAPASLPREDEKTVATKPKLRLSSFGLETQGSGPGLAAPRRLDVPKAQQSDSGAWLDSPTPPPPTGPGDRPRIGPEESREITALGGRAASASPAPTDSDSLSAVVRIVVGVVAVVLASAFGLWLGFWQPGSSSAEPEDPLAGIALDLDSAAESGFSPPASGEGEDPSGAEAEPAGREPKAGAEPADPLAGAREAGQDRSDSEKSSPREEADPYLADSSPGPMQAPALASLPAGSELTLRHRPVRRGRVGASTLISVQVSAMSSRGDDVPAPGSRVELHWRLKDGIYRTVTLPETGWGRWEGWLSFDGSQGSIVEYWIEVTHPSVSAPARSGTPSTPHRVVLD